MNTLFTNGNITIAEDLIFGLSVLTDHGWCPLSELDKDDLNLVVRLIDNNPTFPWKEELSTLLN